MPRRIFIAINLPEKIRNQLVNYQKKWPELPIRWTKKDNLHITLVFIGYVKDEEIPEICQIVEEIAGKNNIFTISLNKIVYAPPKKMPPRMVWVSGEKSEQLTKLQRASENSLLASPLRGDIKQGKRLYSPHVTLGRIKRWDFKQLEIEERPNINEDVSFSFEVNSIEIMESQLKRTGAEYTVLESVPLGNKTIKQ